jgi:uncharacterized membrane protein YhfC
MLAAAYVLSFLGMIVLPILLWIYFTRKFALSWKLILAGALTFIASQVLHIPLVLGMNSLLQTLPLLVNAIILGLLAGVFEETARYLLFKFILRDSKSWKEGILVGLGQGGIEAVLLGILAAVGFATMIGYRSIDLSTVPGIPADQLELARQQVEAYWSVPSYMALMGFVERVFAICLHVSLSVMVLYAIVYGKPVWFWLALLWHAFVDAVAVYVGQQVGILAVEGIVAVFAMISVWIVWKLRSDFLRDAENFMQPTMESTV